VRSACETTKQVVYLSVHQDGGRYRVEISKILETEAIIAEISMSWHNEQTPEGAPVVRRARSTKKYSSGIEILDKYIQRKWKKAMIARLLPVMRKRTEQTLEKF
jgi:hypothetical protein